METQKTELFIKMVLDMWNTQNSRIAKLLDTLTDEQFLAETSPGRNRGIYLIGHLIAVSDGLLPLLGFGERIYPELNKIFVESPDRAIASIPTMNELRTYWKSINARLAEHFGTTKPEEWFSKHNAVSVEDFAKEPHRNKLNVIINRTNHTSYHHGQLMYLVKK